uniref:Uncharacterized protein n=1 Tax=Xiphophorus couchianus TaxID=32473 RepID=A0A3B5KYZ6_9TELE
MSEIGAELMSTARRLHQLQLLLCASCSPPGEPGGAGLTAVSLHALLQEFMWMNVGARRRAAGPPGHPGGRQRLRGGEGAEPQGERIQSERGRSHRGTRSNQKGGGATRERVQSERGRSHRGTRSVRKGAEPQGNAFTGGELGGNHLGSGEFWSATGTS